MRVRDHPVIETDLETANQFNNQSNRGEAMAFKIGGLVYHKRGHLRAAGHPQTRARSGQGSFISGQPRFGRSQLTRCRGKFWAFWAYFPAQGPAQPCWWPKRRRWVAHRARRGPGRAAAVALREDRTGAGSVPSPSPSYPSSSSATCDACPI